MTQLMREFEQAERRRRRSILFVVLACLTGLGVWLTAPLGIVELTRGSAIGWMLVACGAVLLAATVLLIVAVVRLRAVPESLPGKANARFDEPQASQDPRGGYSMVGTQLGSH
ncbi:hypothetical protein AB4Z18_10350 [Leifsonia sp. 2TAF2]|uniref:hypothetical protein n=1 Tax=Leifsonia sp. 2TAF2 TaxID=3233009 RepID=UPI003F9C3C2C